MGRKPNDQMTYFVDRLFKRWQCYIKAEERIKLTEFTKKGESFNVLVSATGSANLKITNYKCEIVFFFSKFECFDICDCTRLAGPRLSDHRMSADHLITTCL